MPFDPIRRAYVDTRVTRGFPLGGMGAGGFSLNTDGSVGELRCNNNWMCPVRGLVGAFQALWTRAGARVETRLLRGGSDAEYDNAHPIRSTTFLGMLPAFTLRYDDDLPLRIALHGFTPHVPHDVRASTLPAAVFRFRLHNPGPDRVEASVLFSFENALGRGGTGLLGVQLGPEQEMQGVYARVVYDSVAGNWQEAVTLGGRRGVRFRTDQRYDPHTHRAGVAGAYLLLADAAPGLDVTICDGWNAAASRASVLDDFARDGRLRSPESGRRGEDGIYRPAAAVAAAMHLASGETRDVIFALTWWTPDHVTQPGLVAGRADGVRVGHVYETYFPSVDAVATHVLDERERLESASTEVTRLLQDSTLPRWLVVALANAIDSTLCNTVVPANGRMYTLEGLDWVWPMGGLTGTNDQRLAAHPYASVFFPALDLSELDEFRRLADARGAIPHGNGNCDLGLGTTDVPYGWPLYIKDFLPAKEWTDLSMSFVLQVGKHWRLSGDRPVLDRFWPALVRAADYLDSLAPHGVPEGGTTYDVWDFPGTFVYSATLYLATLATMTDLAATAEPSRANAYRERQARAAARLETLWDARGFYRTCETSDTIFTAALAGDWAARYAGLDPVVPPARAASHLRHQHRVLVEAAAAAAAGRWRALPRAEAHFDGSPMPPHPMSAGSRRDEEFVYVWQVLSYQAMAQIYVGEVAAGLETIRTVTDRLWEDGNAWSGGLRGDGESVYMTHPVLWAVLNALTGAALDVPGRTLHLSPRVGGEIARLRCPIFFPTFWAALDHDPASGRTVVEVLRAFGTPTTIARVVHRRASGEVRTIEVAPTTLAPGVRLTLELPA